ncbi:esterase-like activity of phytase family protein [Sphingomonas bacterium]|uniref:esterase-like activity of phytase family protein n=1 Tax=Sphingomonas bacterium TaxID=1895847 RepID=UPI00262E1C2F|nr:esterase-like activity of phytase family protein [Sphingomonas bacterium]
MRARTLLFVVVAVCGAGTGWSGESRLDLFGARPQMTATRVPLDPDDPTRRRIGRLTFMGGVHLTSADPAFGGFSALAVVGDRVTMLSDGGNIVAFRLGGDGQLSDQRFAALPGGPATGWRKLDRDSEALAIDPRTGATWVAFERANQIWRYSSALRHAQASARPAAMRRWRANGGAEALVRRRDGSFVAIEEGRAPGRPWRAGLVWAGDPTVKAEPAFRFRYLPPAGYDPADAVELPDGRLLVLNRWFGLPLRFANILVAIDPHAIRSGAAVRGQVIARLAAPLTHDNFEGVAASVERGRTIIWLLSDDNQTSLERTLLLKFRLDDPPRSQGGGSRVSG